jgi:hypothetical protein
VNVCRIDESNYKREYEESTDAIKDFLYMAFEIAGDCQPIGDWTRAELGTVDPFRYLDVAYEYEYQFRSEQEVQFLHRSAALNLLCRLAVHDEDGTRHQPELVRIREAFESGRVVSLPVLDRAFRAGLDGTEDFVPALKLVNAEIVRRTFAALSLVP